jgi:hypothetical protein
VEKQFYDSFPITLPINPADSNQCALTFNTVCGLYYNLQSTIDMSLSFANEPGGLVQALDTSMVRLDGGNPRKFYRVVSSLGP